MLKNIFCFSSLSICLNKQISKMNFMIFLLGSSLSLFWNYLPLCLSFSSSKFSFRSSFLHIILLKIKLFTYQFLLRLPSQRAISLCTYVGALMMWMMFYCLMELSENLSHFVLKDVLMFTFVSGRQDSKWLRIGIFFRVKPNLNTKTFSIFP